MIKNKSVIVLWIVIVLNLSIAIFNFYTAFHLNFGKVNYYTSNEITFDNLSYSDKIFANDMLNDLKPEYKLLVNKIEFSKNEDYIDSKCGGSAGGCNIRNGDKIYILYYDSDLCYTRTTLCHEILHSLVYPKAGINDLNKFDTEEFFVRDIDDYEVCFKEIECSNLNFNHYIEKCQDCEVGYCQGINTYSNGWGECCQKVYSQEEYENTEVCWFTKT